MILTIYTCGSKILRIKCEHVKKDYPNLKQLINNMFETLQNAHGIGLAAPQIGLGIQLFIVDGSPLNDIILKNLKQVFINPKIINQEGDDYFCKEGCLSIPGIQEEVSRKPKIRVLYEDNKFIKHDEVFDGVPARIIIHEYDHTQGILLIDRLSSLTMGLLKNKLKRIIQGKVETDYPIKFLKSNKNDRINE